MRSMALGVTQRLNLKPNFTMETGNVSLCSTGYINLAEITLKRLVVTQLKHELENSGVAKRTST